MKQTLITRTKYWPDIRKRSTITIKSFLFALFIGLSFPADASPPYDNQDLYRLVPDEGRYIDIDLPDTKIKTIKTARLLVKDWNGESVLPSLETYLIVSQEDYHDMVMTYFTGHHASFELSNIDKDPQPELIVTYSNNTTIKKYFEFNHNEYSHDTLEPIPGATFVSNTNTFKIKGSKVITTNTETDNSGGWQTRTTVHDVINGKYEIIATSSAPMNSE